MEPKIFFMTFRMTAVVLLVEGGSLLIGLQSLRLPLVAFSMPILWILWLCCFFRKTGGDFWRLIFLWVLIDIAALSVVMTAEAFLGRTGRNDVDYLFVIVFSPVIFPTFLIARNFSFLNANIISLLESIAGSPFLRYSNISLQSWVCLSILAAISVSSLVVATCLLKFLRDSLRQRKSP